MNPRLARALLIVAVCALMAALSVAASFLEFSGVTPSTVAMAKGFGAIVWSNFRYYLAWAVVTPGVLWLGRKVPLTRTRWRWPLAFHLVLPVLGGGPFYVVVLVLNAVLGWRLPPFQLLADKWWTIVAAQAVMVPPIYWLILAAGAGLQFYREFEAKQVEAIALQRGLAAARLDGLRMKMQPHFLFNTLNAMASLARTSDTDGVVRVVERLGTLLRLSMETGGRQLVTLEEELALLDEYLAIEEIRFGDRLHVVRRIDPDTRKALVPNLILQPLIENAIVHGLSRRLDATLLEIAARRKGTELSIAVRDDGPGLPPGWTLADGAGHGLNNILERLEGLYAGAFGFEIGNATTGGAVAQLRVPFADTSASATGSAEHGPTPHDHR
jgi:signal transduction histidine kinase